MPLPGELRGMSNHRPARNAIVAILGTPDRTEGSLDDPREREEDGLLFNEKWIYTDLHRDPGGAAMPNRGGPTPRSWTSPRSGRPVSHRSIRRAIRRLRQAPSIARFPSLPAN